MFVIGNYIKHIVFKTLTGSFFPDDCGLGHAIGLTIDDQLSVPFDVHVHGFDGPLWRHCLVVEIGGGEQKQTKMNYRNRFRHCFTYNT